MEEGEEETEEGGEVEEDEDERGVGERSTIEKPWRQKEEEKVVIIGQGRGKDKN